MFGQQQSNELSRARAAAHQGHVDEARELFKRALNASPRNMEILLELGILEGQSGNMERARRWFEKAHKLNKMDPNVHFNLGHVERADNKLDKAARLFTRTLELEAGYPDAAFGLGETLYAQGKAEEALAWLDQALRAAPQDSEILHVKALSLKQLGRQDEAIAAFRETVRLNPGFRNAQINLATTLINDTDLDEAAALIDRAEQIEPIPDQLLTRVADIFVRRGELQRATHYVDRSINAGLNLAEANAVKGQIASWEGDFDESETALRRAIELDPRHGVAYSRLAQIKRLEPEKAPLLKKILKDETAGAPARIGAGFALFYANQKLKNYDEAFEALNAANTIQFDANPFSEETHKEALRRTLNTFTPEFFSAHAGDGFDGEGTVFIVGMPRSGTTLVEQVLASYDDVNAGGERLDIPLLRRSIDDYPHGVHALPASWAGDAGRQIHESMFDGNTAARFATDKLPGNYAMVGLIAWILPKSRFIYCHRDPCDNALSLFEQNFGPNLRFSGNLESSAVAYLAHLEFLKHWTDTCGIEVFDLDYDKFVSDPEPNARALVNYVGLDWNENCLYPERVERSIATASQWQARQPINAKSIGRWKTYRDHMQPFIDRLEAGL